MSFDCNWRIIHKDEELWSWRFKQTSFNYKNDGFSCRKYGVILQLTYEFMQQNFRHIRTLEDLDIYFAKDIIENYAKLNISHQTYLDILYDYDFCRDCFLIKLRTSVPLDGLYPAFEGFEYTRMVLREE